MVLIKIGNIDNSVFTGTGEDNSYSFQIGYDYMSTQTAMDELPSGIVSIGKITNSRFNAESTYRNAYGIYLAKNSGPIITIDGTLVSDDTIDSISKNIMNDGKNLKIFQLSLFKIKRFNSLGNSGSIL